jgi:hypothetical protein
LDQAVQSKEVNKVKLLLAHGAELHSWELGEAIFAAPKEIMNLIIESKNFNPWTQGDEFSVIIAVIRLGDKELLEKIILKRGWNLPFLNSDDPDWKLLRNGLKRFAVEKDFETLEFISKEIGNKIPYVKRMVSYYLSKACIIGDFEETD